MALTFTDKLEKVVNGTMLPDVASKYLTLYVGEVDDWERHIGILYARLKRKHGEEEAKSLLRQTVSFTIMLPVYDRSTRIDPEHPENLLYWSGSYHQFNDRDWFADLQKIIEQDIKIEQWRNQALSLGVIDPIEYQPYCRQAYNWLYGKAEETNAIGDKSATVKRFRNLVWAYGGAVVSYLFTNHSDLIQRKVLNWRTGYFFERAIFDAYTIDQVLKIKKAELEKTSGKLKKTIAA